jgi:hypothetical protein
VEVINSHEFVFDNQKFEAVQGYFHFQFDPNHPQNINIVDLEKAQTNELGRVEASSDFFLIQPKIPSKRKGMLIEISNRGSKASLRYFNQGPREALPKTAAALGDGLIQRLGLSMLWVGWQPDVVDNERNMNVHLPQTDVQGMVRSDWTLETSSDYLRVAHRDQIDVIYPIDLSKKNSAYLTVREGRNALRKIVPKGQWQFDEQGDGIIGKFEPGIYELVYPSQHGLVIGLGQALLRDTAEYVKSQNTPYIVPKTIAFGVSQTGRWLRHFLYQGLNQTESGDIAFDGMFIHTAGAGRGSFNHRFAQPSRDAHRMSAFFYPTDLFPYTSTAVENPLTGKKEGLLSHLSEQFIPKIYVTNTGYEYWGRAAGLIHSFNHQDVKPHPKERIFHLASGQHFVERIEGLKPLNFADGYFQGNPLNFQLSLRALLSSLTQWVTNDAAVAQKSRYPQFEDGSLLRFEDYRLPEYVAHLDIPKSPHTAYLVDYGNRWAQGIIDNVPPRILAEFTPPVPAVDKFGNELGGLRHPLLEEPLAVFMPWVLRHNKFADDEMMDFRGSLQLLERTEVLKRYPDWMSYLAKLETHINNAIAQKTLLAEDKYRVIEQAKWLWQQVMHQQS